MKKILVILATLLTLTQNTPKSYASENPCTTAFSYKDSLEKLKKASNSLKGQFAAMTVAAVISALVANQISADQEEAALVLHADLTDYSDKEFVAKAKKFPGKLFDARNRSFVVSVVRKDRLEVLKYIHSITSEKDLNDYTLSTLYLADIKNAFDYRSKKIFDYLVHFPQEVFNDTEIVDAFGSELVRAHASFRSTTTSPEMNEFVLDTIEGSSSRFDIAGIYFYLNEKQAERILKFKNVYMSHMNTYVERSVYGRGVDINAMQALMLFQNIDRFLNDSEMKKNDYNFFLKRKIDLYNRLLRLSMILENNEFYTYYANAGADPYHDDALDLMAKNKTFSKQLQYVAALNPPSDRQLIKLMRRLLYNQNFEGASYMLEQGHINLKQAGEELFVIAILTENKNALDFLRQRGVDIVVQNIRQR